MYGRIFKRVFDILLSGIALALLAPFFLLIVLVIRLEDGCGALFIHERVGQNGRRFRLLKFRSMPINTDNKPSAVAHNLKITRTGRFIRRTNIDELPQLINILKGDMSVVGPRPALPVQERLLALRVHNGADNCRPGLTGLAQVHSYNGMPEDEKAEWDGHYAGGITFFGDVTIILKTFVYLLKQPPVY